MEFKGTIVFKSEPIVVSEKLTKQIVVLEELGGKEYPASIAIDFLGDKMSMLNDVKLGDVIDAQLNFRANESKKTPGQYFNSISCWRLTKDAHMTENGVEEEGAPF